MPARHDHTDTSPEEALGLYLRERSTEHTDSTPWYPRWLIWHRSDGSLRRVVILLNGTSTVPLSPHQVHDFLGNVRFNGDDVAASGRQCRIRASDLVPVVVRDDQRSYRKAHV